MALPISIEESDHSLGLLKRLDQAVQKDPIKTTVAEFDAIFMMLRRRCSRAPPVWLDTQEHSALDTSTALQSPILSIESEGYAGQEHADLRGIGRLPPVGALWQVVDLRIARFAESSRIEFPAHLNPPTTG
jgi:hypothetical protein